MGLIACPVCLAKVSEQALNCPHCGHPLAPTAPTPKETATVRKGGKYELIGFLTILASIFVGLSVSTIIGVVLFLVGFAIFIFGRFY